MPISTSLLKAHGQLFSKSAGTFSVDAAKSQGMRTAFLCHSHKDRDLVDGVRQWLYVKGWEVYIDWLDPELPITPDASTADKIRTAISQRDWFLFLATPNSMTSRWCPWEIGLADQSIGAARVIIIPTESGQQNYGSEYLGLYVHLDERDSVLKWFKPGFSHFGESMGTLR